LFIRQNITLKCKVINNENVNIKSNVKLIKTYATHTQIVDYILSSNMLLY